jgi:hypothetical protein
MRRGWPAGILIALSLAGCYGSTEPATNVTATGATLHGKGTANNGPASSYFEYWPTGRESDKRKTFTRSWPAGASGPISEAVSGLMPDTEYSFRICGSDSGGQAVCAQTRTFRSGKGDWVDAVFAYEGRTAGVSAGSGPSGENPSGLIQVVVSSIPRTYPVTCLAVTGNRAIVGAVRSPGDAVIWGIEDGSLAHRGISTPGTPDCQNTDFDSLPQTTAPSGRATVHDEQP